ncbi:M20 family metallo-hydrolase [Utexia brackfieldae]|uniref:M20 family metallo-hydrolase n=1 Tax=Utexia brackfieldae TaxID=3074108 RepID=UPI00370D1861
MSLNEQTLHHIWQQLSTFNRESAQPGLTRLAYSLEDEAALQFIRELAIKQGFEVRQDAVGNLFIRLPGRNRYLPAVGTGSHLDSVPQGGHYDGIVGVLCGLYALNQFSSGQLNRDLELIVFRCEESSRFGLSCLGSKSLFAEHDHTQWALAKDNEGIDFFQAVQAAGYSINHIKQNHLADDYFSAFIEVHIEQGQTLEINQKQIGIVTGIAAPTRYRVDIHGHAAHSGATPMTHRQDALVSAAEIILQVKQLAEQESIYSTVATVGKLIVSPNSMNVIPGHVQLFIDIRGIDIQSIHRLDQQLAQLFAHLNDQKIVKIDLLRLSHELPLLLDQDIQHLLKQQCENRQTQYMLLPSGAGHDAMNMAKHYPTGMIFIPSKGGISHHHEEYSQWQDIMLSAQLLTNTLAELASC